MWVNLFKLYWNCGIPRIWSEYSRSLVPIFNRNIENKCCYFKCKHCLIVGIFEEEYDEFDYSQIYKKDIGIYYICG